MKKTALLAAAAAFAAASPAMAHGYVGLEYGAGSIDAPGPDTDSDIWQGEGAVGFGGAGWGAQVNGAVAAIDSDTGDADAWDLGGHLWWDGGGWRFGGVVAVTEVDPDIGGGDVTEWAYGIEGTWAVTTNADLIGSLTAGESDVDGGGDADLWNLDAQGIFFANPNMSFGALLGFGNVDGGGADSDTFSYGINAEFQPWSAPISITIAWNGFDIDDSDVTSDVFSIGARWNFGGGTLQERHQSAPFDTHTGFADRTFGIW
jgi:hypothetical protein